MTPAGHQAAAMTKAAPASPSGRGWWMATLAAALAGALLVARLPVNPYENPDSRSFVALAESVARGAGLSYQDQGAPGRALKAFRPPLYPLALGGLLALGLPLRAALPLQGALCGVTVMLLAWLARQVGGRRVAWIAGGAAALWWSAWLSAGQYLTETLYAFLLVATMAATARALRRGGRGAAFSAGALAGAGLLARATGLATGAACATLLAMRAPKLVPAFALGLLLLWTPWAARNRAVLGEWEWLQTSGGLNLWTGSTGAPVGEAWTVMARELPLRGEVGMDREFRRRARQWMAAHPLRVLGRAGQRALQFLVSLDRSLEYLPYRLACPLVLLGAAVAVRDPRWTLPLLVWLLHGALGAVTVMSQRYRLPAEYPALLLGAAGVEWMASRWGSLRCVLAAAAVLLAGGAAWWIQVMVRGGG